MCEEEDQMQLGDLADMVRSSANHHHHHHHHRRGGGGDNDNIYTQDVSATVVCSYNNNYHQNTIWSLTSSADFDETRVDHNLNSTTTSHDEYCSCCLLDDAIIVEYMQAAAATTTTVVADDDPFTTTTVANQQPLIDLHDPPNSNNNNNNDFYNDDCLFLSDQQHELLQVHLPIITTSTSNNCSSGCSSMKSFKSKPEAAAPLAAYVSTGIMNMNRGCHTLSSSSSVSSWQPPPINCNVFSQMLHISSSTNDIMLAPSDPVPASPSSIMVQPQPLISSPRNPAIKRSRKSQSKKVVCIPAPAPANSRPSGEVVPSDLWAWRKYGQKPIKGSPYPRGYYRCSSSKGCSARKQVERSRTDPNMLVITYTSEHNHPWPTQRNALAGSIRSHPSKNNTASSNSSWTTSTTGVLLVNDQILIKNGIGIPSDELEPADETATMNKQRKVDNDHNLVDHGDIASVQDYLNDDQRPHDNYNKGDHNNEGDEDYWRCSYKKMSTYMPRSTVNDRAEEYDEQSVQEDLFGELGEIASWKRS